MLGEVGPDAAPTPGSRRQNSSAAQRLSRSSVHALEQLGLSIVKGPDRLASPVIHAS